MIVNSRNIFVLRLCAHNGVRKDWVSSMYKTSKDRRFQKNKRELRRAFIDLCIEQGYQKISISSLAERADLNRMTFYSHYDAIEDVFQEFVDDMTTEIARRIKEEKEFTIDGFIAILNSVMFREIEFFRYVARTNSRADFKTAFKDAIRQLIQIDLKKNPSLTKQQQLILCDLDAVCIAYSYLDWLAGDYGEDTTLDEVMAVTKSLMKDHLPWVTYR